VARFDELLQCLQASLVSAQEALSRHAEELKRATPPDDLNCIIPRGGGGAGEELLTLNGSSMLRPIGRTVVSLALSFDCELRRNLLLDLAETCSLVILRAETSQDPGARPAQRRNMRITFTGQERPVGEVLLDGQLLAAVASRAAGDQGKPEEAQEARRSLRLRLLDRLLDVAGSPGFVLSREQAARAREIPPQVAPGQG
jgi:hypothetical protein